MEIADLLIVLAGAFSDALAKERIDISVDSYWTRLRNSLANTDVGIRELGLKAGSDGAGVDLNSSSERRLCLGSVSRNT